jgi:hypothetical protein
MRRARADAVAGLAKELLLLLQIPGACPVPDASTANLAGGGDTH